MKSNFVKVRSLKYLFCRAFACKELFLSSFACGGRYSLNVSEIDACYLLACNRFFFNGVLSSVKVSYRFKQVVNMNQITLVMYIYFY